MPYLNSEAQWTADIQIQSSQGGLPSAPTQDGGREGVGSWLSLHHRPAASLNTPYLNTLTAVVPVWKQITPLPPTWALTPFPFLQKCHLIFPYHPADYSPGPLLSHSLFFLLALTISPSLKYKLHKTRTFILHII